MSWEHRSADFCKGQVDAQMAYIDAEREVDRLERENAKVRELVADMWSYINAPVNQRNSLKERLAVYDDLADRMRELGVEVDG